MVSIAHPARAGNTSHIPGLLSGPTPDPLGGHSIVEVWTAGQHAERRLRELRKASPGVVRSATNPDSSAMWRGAGNETVMTVVITYPSKTKVPPPSPAGAVRAALRREPHEDIDADASVATTVGPLDPWLCAMAQMYRFVAAGGTP